MKKALLISSLIFSVCLCFLLGRQAFKINNSISIWNSFQEYVSSGQPVQDCPFVKKGASLINFKEQRIISTKVDIRRTIQAHFLDRNKKVVLAGAYVEIEDGKIIHLKLL